VPVQVRAGHRLSDRDFAREVKHAVESSLAAYIPRLSSPAVHHGTVRGDGELAYVSINLAGRMSLLAQHAT
jgi:hypothetical protein